MIVFIVLIIGTLIILGMIFLAKYFVEKDYGDGPSEDE